MCRLFLDEQPATIHRWPPIANSNGSRWHGLRNSRGGNFPWNYYPATEVQFEGGIVRPVEDGDCQKSPFGTLHVSVPFSQNQTRAPRRAPRGWASSTANWRSAVCAQFPSSAPVLMARTVGTTEAIFGLTNDEARTLLGRISGRWQSSRGAGHGGQCWPVDLTCQRAQSRVALDAVNRLGEGGKPYSRLRRRLRPRRPGRIRRSPAVINGR